LSALPIISSRDLRALSSVPTRRCSDLGTHVAPKINLRYELGWGQDWRSFTRLSWGQGYRVPNLKERHYLFDHSSLGYIVVGNPRSEEHTSELQSRENLVCRLLIEKKKV